MRPRHKAAENELATLEIVHLVVQRFNEAAA